MSSSVTGKAFRFGENVDTDQIIPAEFLVTADPQELGSHVFEKARPGFRDEVQEGDIIVADRNFGCGSSREHAPIALMGAGVSCVVAESFARIFYRNSINIGLPVIEAEIEAGEGDELEVVFDEGKILNKTTGKEYSFNPLPDFLQNMIDSGGLIEYTKSKLK